ncbi:hypothetical protein DSO57_1022107 [Entomophthora muscae]|uniref:Uncharacterized protein n=1 Tax=Entomophthora muscae TaxID=34485 RepID=A0ACC2U1J5_9FUNG|nr:hypothetical protein DSO57_1022107 [Entomophthora muscae]
MHSSFGGRSHIGRMLDIGDELVRLGHNVSYVALSDNMVFAEGTRLERCDLGAAGVYKGLKQMAQKGLMQDRYSIQRAFLHVHKNVLDACYKAEHPRLARALQSPPDLLVCDAIAYACQDLARELGIPLIISAQAYNPQQLEAIERKHVILDYGMLISTSYLGLEPAMNYPPSLRFVGPLPMATPTLDSDSLDFLTAHPRVAYVGFGSLLALTKQEVKRILDALQASVEADLLDGVIWGAAATDLTSFPSTLAINSTQTPLKNLNHFKILPWANQHAILNHPNTKLFITHAGLESLMEAIDTKTPSLAMPFVFDQPRNAHRISALGIGQTIPINCDATTILCSIKTTLQAKHNLANIHAIAHSDPTSLQSAANLILAYLNTATVCRKASPFDPHATHPPCELAYLIPTPTHLSYIQATLFLVLALPLYLLLTRLSIILHPKPKLTKVD